MRRYFNTEGQCEPDMHYMVRLDDRLKKIRERSVDGGSYFVINRGIQYGKTTTLRALAEYIRKDYAVISLDFQKMSDENFRDERAFTTAFIEQIALVYTINVMKMLHKLCKNQIHVKPSIMDELVSIQASITVRLASDRFFIAETKRLSRLLSDWAIQHINKNTSSMHVCFRILDVFLFCTRTRKGKIYLSCSIAHGRPNETCQQADGRYTWL